MDQCKHCTYRGDLKKCLDTPCSYHELWMVKEVINSARELFESILVLAVEGPAVDSKAVLCKAIENEAKRGYALCSETLEDKP